MFIMPFCDKIKDVQTLEKGSAYVNCEKEVTLFVS